VNIWELPQNFKRDFGGGFWSYFLGWAFKKVVKENPLRLSNPIY